MARYTGICSHCGDKNHPKGNVFTVRDTVLWECGVTHAQAAREGFIFPTTEMVKTCNNCGQAHPFAKRVSAKAKAMEARLQATLAWLDAQEA